MYLFGCSSYKPAFRDDVSLTPGFSHVHTFSRLYFQPDMVNESFTAEGRLSSAALAVVISTLVCLVSESTLGDFVSLERILRELLDLGHVDEDLKQELWARFIELASSVPTENAAVLPERRREIKALLILLKMISSYENLFIKINA